MKIKIDLIGYLLRYNQFIIIIIIIIVMEGKINLLLTRNLLTDGFYSYRQLKRQQVTNVNSYNDKAWALEADDNLNLTKKKKYFIG